MTTSGWAERHRSERWAFFLVVHHQTLDGTSIVLGDDRGDGLLTSSGRPRVGTTTLTPGSWSVMNVPPAFRGSGSPSRVSGCGCSSSERGDRGGLGQGHAGARGRTARPRPISSTITTPARRSRLTGCRAGRGSSQVSARDGARNGENLDPRPAVAWITASPASQYQARPAATTVPSSCLTSSQTVCSLWQRDRRRCGSRPGTHDRGACSTGRWHIGRRWFGRRAGR